MQAGGAARRRRRRRVGGGQGVGQLLLGAARPPQGLVRGLRAGGGGGFEGADAGRVAQAWPLTWALNPRSAVILT
jgi:hypothetical protein